MAVVYITSDYQQMQELKHTIHVKKVVQYYNIVMKAKNVNISVQIQRMVAKKNSLPKKPMKNTVFTRMLKVNKEWNFEWTEKDFDEIICCLSSYDQNIINDFFTKKNINEFQ